MHRGRGLIEKLPCKDCFSDKELLLVGRENCDHHLQPTSVQDPGLVLEQTEGYYRRKIFPADFLVGRFKAA